MEADPVRNITSAELLASARQVLGDETQALAEMSQRLDDSFCQAIAEIDRCQGNVLVCGMGKAGLVGQKVMATMGSLGIRSHFLHPAEAVHGDLGRVRSDDCIIMFSQSGETEEIVRLLDPLRDMRVPIIAVTGNCNSTLARRSTVVLDLHSPREACPMGLAPSTSTTMMLAMGDALALVLSKVRHFSERDFARNHPAGSLGKQLSRVEAIMRPLDQCRVASEKHTIRKVFIELSRPGRRSGAIMLVNEKNQLCGVFTDSDLARLFERGEDTRWDEPIENVMTRAPWAVLSGTMLAEAVELMAQRKISELPVVDGIGKPIGLIDITDVVGFFPKIRSLSFVRESESGGQTNENQANKVCKRSDGQDSGDASAETDDISCPISLIPADSEPLAVRMSRLSQEMNSTPLVKLFCPVREKVA